MNETGQVVGILGAVTAVCGVLLRVGPPLLQELKERRLKAHAQGKAPESVQLAELAELANVRKELRESMARLEAELSEQRTEIEDQRATYYDLREAVGRLLRRSLLKQYEARGEFRSGRHDEGLRLLDEGIRELEHFDLPPLKSKPGAREAEGQKQ